MENAGEDASFCDVLEIVQGNRIEAIFMKPKQKVEKIRINYSIKDEEEKDTADDDDDDEVN